MAAVIGHERPHHMGDVNVASGGDGEMAPTFGGLDVGVGAQRDDDQWLRVPTKAVVQCRPEEVLELAGFAPADLSFASAVGSQAVWRLLSLGLDHQPPAAT